MSTPPSTHSQPSIALALLLRRQLRDIQRGNGTAREQRSLYQRATVLTGSTYGISTRELQRCINDLTAIADACPQVAANAQALQESPQ